jgi:hypothetical protein
MLISLKAEMLLRNEAIGRCIKLPVKIKKEELTGAFCDELIYLNVQFTSNNATRRPIGGKTERRQFE